MEMQRLDSAVGIPVLKNNTCIEDNSHNVMARTASSTMERSGLQCRPNDADKEHISPDSQAKPPARLLNLPSELQLIIWRYAVIEDRPLLVNGPCDSSFNGWTEEYYASVAMWKDGTKKPPEQPGITRVCRSVRDDALPMFYKYNRFQSGYCYETDMDMTLGWLRCIGEANRALMRSFYFFDANYEHDRNCPNDLKKVRRGPVIREMDGRMSSSSYSDDGCRHDILFRTKLDDHDDLEGLFQLFDVGLRMSV